MKVERTLWLGLMAGVAAMTAATASASAQQQKGPDIKMLMTRDAGWNDFGAYPEGAKTTSSNALPIQYVQEWCYFFQSSTGGYTIEECRPFMPWRLYDLPPVRRFRRDSWR
jgi:hypothetical protein